MKNAYIIGNGFDLHHEINSSYSDFSKWLEANSNGVFCQMGEVYGISNNEMWWSDFEQNLASLDVLTYGTGIASISVPDLSDDHCDRMWDDARFCVETQLNELFTKLRNCFNLWLHQLNQPNKSKQVEILRYDSKFLVFNYTKTIENLYGILNRDVLHIHGCIDDGGSLVLGHNKGEEYYRKHVPKDCEIYEAWAIEAAIAGVVSQRKPVENLIDANKMFFRSLCNLERVFVYGFSFSPIDEPYLNLVASNCKTAKWEISYFNVREIETILNFVRKNRISNYSLVKLDDRVI